MFYARMLTNHLSTSISLAARRCGLVIIGLALLTWTALAAEVTAANGVTPPAVSFTKEIAPILTKKCLNCHGPEKAKGGYQLHNFESMMKPGDNGNAPLVAGKPDTSELYQRLIAKDEDDRMPQKDDPLSAAQIALIERWIKEGPQFDGLDAKASITSIIPKGPHPAPPDVYRVPIPLTALVFSPDGRELAIGGYHEISIWDHAEGKLLRRIKNIAQRTQALAYQSNGSLLAAAGGSPGQSGEVVLIDPIKGALVKVLGTMSDVMLSVCFSIDGTRVAAGGADNSIHLFDVAGGKEQLLIQQHADWVMAVAFHPDGSHLASASRDRSARIYDSKTGALETTYADHGAPVFGVGFSNDGKRVLSGGRDKKIVIWDFKEAKKSGELSGFAEDVTKLLARGDFVFSCSADRLVRQHDIKERNLIRTFSGHKDWVHALDFHPATKRLATGSHDGEVRVWNTEDGKLISKFVAAPGYLAASASK
jgi:WD40 repeat protein